MSTSNKAFTGLKTAVGSALVPARQSQPGDTVTHDAIISFKNQTFSPTAPIYIPVVNLFQPGMSNQPVATHQIMAISIERLPDFLIVSGSPPSTLTADVGMAGYSNGLLNSVTPYKTPPGASLLVPARTIYQQFSLAGKLVFNNIALRIRASDDTIYNGSIRVKVVLQKI